MVRRRLLFLLPLLAGCGGSEAQEAAREGRLDGLWQVVTINGKAPAASFLLRIRRGRVVGGRDGCNSWGFDLTLPPAPDGTRMIISDAQGCPQTPERRAYWRALGNGNVRPAMAEDGKLRLSVGEDEVAAVPIPPKGAASARP
jgi:hypothetical protein